MPSANASADREINPGDLHLIDQVWGRLQARLDRGLIRIDRIVSSLFDRALEPGEVLEAVSLGELIAAKLGVLGLGSSAELIRKAIVVLEQQDLGMSHAIGLSSLLDDARMAIATNVAELKALTRTGEPLAVVGSVSEVADEILWVAAAQGLPVSHHHDGVLDADQDVAALVVVLDDENVARSKPMLRSIRETHPTQPILLSTPGYDSSDRDLSGRAAVADLVSLMIPRNTHPIEVVTEVRKEITRSRQPRSLSVFGVNATLLAEPLWRRGLAARTEARAEELLARLASGESRGVILMPATGALTPDQLVRLIRTDPRTRSSVIVMISDSLDPVRVQGALRDGVDDVFGTHVDADDLAVAIKARLRRRAELEPVADSSEHRGTVPWSTATMMIERMLLVGFRRSTPVGIGVLRLANGNRLDDGASDRPYDSAADALDEAIAREFRGEDVISRMDGGHLVVALNGVSRRILMKRLGDLQQKYELAELECRAVGLEFPLDGRSLGELLEEARHALDRIGDEGGPWLAGADWRPWSAEAPDVLLVDPDRTLGVVVGEALERRGIKVDYEPDALIALDALTGRGAKPLPRVILMELDQRGIDGMALLRHLRDAGTMHRSKVVVLSARAQESDLRMAFELGAEDFVGKPFSTPLLVHRLSKVLDP